MVVPSCKTEKKIDGKMIALNLQTCRKLHLQLVKGTCKKKLIRKDDD
jgi:hypothetical protein